MTIQEWLVDYVRTAGAVAGTNHQREGDGPAPLCRIEYSGARTGGGKGMAGQATVAFIKKHNA